MKFVIACLLIVPAVLAQSNLSCRDLEQKGEVGIQKLLFMAKDSKLPKTEQDFTNYCNSGKELYKGLREYKRCLKPLPQEVLGTATKSIANVLKKHCGDKQGREDTLKVLRCASDDALQEVKVCATQTLNVLEYLSQKNVNTKQLVPQLCCMAQITKSCLFSKIRSVCQDKSISVNEHFSKLVSAISKDVIDLACEDYKTMKQCEQKLPSEMQTLRQVANQPGPDLSKRQFVAPVIKIGEKIVE